MKMDIEYSEWASLEAMLKDGSLRNVKQLAMELHFRLGKGLYKYACAILLSTNMGKSEHYYLLAETRMKLYWQLPDSTFLFEFENTNSL